jgi:hypothetical protein
MKKLLLLCCLLPNLLTAQLVINEIAPNNRYYDDEDLTFPDWIEIMNIGAYNINVAQFSITDNPDNINKWLLPDMVIYAGEKLIIYASEKNRDCYGCPGAISNLHTNFKLSNGETLALYDDEDVLIDSITIGPVYAGHVMARIPDGGTWCYSDEPTPDDDNDVTCFAGYATEPAFNTTPGFYAGSVDVTVTGSNVFYTTDGDWPWLSGDAYTGPINISTSKVVKIASIEPGLLPSRAVTGTFFIDETTLLPVVSISSNSCDMFDEGFSCIAAYDGADGWEPDNPQIMASVEYFTAEHQQQFNKNIKFETAGNSSIYVYPQRGMQFTIDEDFGDAGEFQYNIFETYKTLDSLNGFRVRANNDWGNSAARMKDVINNRIAAPTFLVAPSYQNVATFINADYWGHYSAREELDKYFLRNNQGVNIDSLDIIRSGAGEDVWDIAEAGTIDGYNELKTFFNTHSMTNPDHYELALDLIDKENWIDHFALQFFVNNDEMAYNLRMFRSYDPAMKWKFILWDTGAGSECPSCNSIETLINFPYLSEEINMMNELVDNTNFRNDFINRYADLMNYYFTWEIIENLIDVNAAEIEAEIPAHKDRWGSPTVSAWNAGVEELKDFFEPRVDYQRNEIENYFDLNDQIDVTLAVNPAGAGYIKISTIVPENLPWTGVYFDGVPVTITALANPGFTFSHWDDNAFIADVNGITFTNNFTDNTTFTANFTGAAIEGAIVVSEINYNSDSTANSGDWIEFHNTTGTAISLHNYTFSNKEFYNKYIFGQDAIIPAGGYLVVAESKSTFLSVHPGITNVIGDFGFSLYNNGDSIRLFNPVGQPIISFGFGDDFPWPATADGYGRTMEMNFDMLTPEIPESWFAGCMRGSPGVAFNYCGENPMVYEINYRSSDLENAGDWFELFNWGAIEFDLSGWLIKDSGGNTFVIPEGTNIAGGGGYLVFYEDAALFNAQFPSVTNKIGPLNFGYNSSGDVILIYDEYGNLFQSVSFENVAPYPLTPDGGGTALQLINIAVSINAPYNWTESCPEGSPGEAFVTPCANEIVAAPTPTQLIIRPNPATNFVNFELQHFESNGVFDIIDITGKIIYTADCNNSFISLDVSNYNSGIYFVQFRFGNEIVVEKFVKQ